MTKGDFVHRLSRITFNLGYLVTHIKTQNSDFVTTSHLFSFSYVQNFIQISSVVSEKSRLYRTNFEGMARKLHSLARCVLMKNLGTTESPESVCKAGRWNGDRDVRWPHD